MKTLLAILLLSVSGLAQTVKTLGLAGTGKYGIVQVKNADGTINQEYRITAQELSVFHASGKGAPPLLTKTSWETQKSVTTKTFSTLTGVAGMDFEVGDVRELDGELTIKFADSKPGTQFLESFLVLKPGAWSGVLPTVTVPPVELDKLPGKPILSIIAGVMTLK